MGVPQVTCSVCGQLVNKRQTVSVGGSKRACRTHDGVDQQADLAQQEREAQEAKTRTRPKRKVQPLGELIPTCMCCKRQGYRSDVYFDKVMLLVEKHNLVHNDNLSYIAFSDEDRQKLATVLAPLKDFRMLWVVPYEERFVFLVPEGKTISQLAGVSLLCTQCCEVYKVKYGRDLPEMTPERTTLFAVIGQGILDHYRQRALTEIEGSN